jgi:hypothetical protein
MNQRFIDELLKAMCKYYQKEHEELICNLEKWKFSFVETSTIPELKKVVDKFDPNSINENMTLNAFEELAAVGNLIKLEW